MCDDCDWEGVLATIDDLSSDERYEFAEETLGGIYDWVEENGHVTEKQIQAVSNITNSVTG